MPPGAFRTPAHGTRPPPSDADDVAAQIADRLAEHQQAQAMAPDRQDSGLTLVFHALQDLKEDVKGHGAKLGTMAVDMANMNGETRLINQRMESIESNVNTLKRQVEHSGTSTAQRPAIRSAVEPRESSGDKVSISGVVKVIGAIFSGLGLLAGAYFAGRGGATPDKEPPAARAPAVGHTPP